MTATTLSRNSEMRALACQDASDHRINTIPVRTFANRRLPFVLFNWFESRWATHVVYDFAGTARAHLDMPSRRPYAVWVHGWEIWNVVPPTYLRAIAGATLVLVNSAYTLARAGETLAGNRIRMCMLGTPEDSPPEIIGPSSGPPTVMLLGRADQWFAKGHDILIDIWPQIVSAVPNARLILIGGGDELPKVRKLAAASPARESIEIPGFVAEEHMEAYWRRVTVFAMLGFAEGFGIVYAEAMRRGLPVIASTDDGGQEVNVDGVTGFNIPRTDKKRLIEVLVSLLRDHDHARALGASGFRCWREKYSFSAFQRRLENATADFLSA